MKHAKKTAIAVLGLCLTAMASGPAMAYPDHGPGRDYHNDGRGYHDNDWRRHEVANRRDWDRHHGPRPDYVYAPPAVYAPPQPVSTGINLILPFNFN